MAKLVNKLGELLFPHHCMLCGLRCAGALPLCPPCRHTLARNRMSCKRCAAPLATVQSELCGQCLLHPPGFRRAIAPWLYDEQFAYLIKRWKFYGERRLTPLLADLWLEAAQPTPVDVLVPVPLHWRRLWQRGFNQAELLTRELRTRSPALRAIPLQPHLVSRRRPTDAQTGLSARGRGQNLAGAFSAGGAKGLQIAVIDDVMTTGHTAEAICSALLGAGAAGVDIWCLARTPPGSS